MPDTTDEPRLRIVYRSYGQENSKPRPTYYSKSLALTSLLRAVQEIRESVQVVFANDGPIPERLLALMHEHGRVVPVDGGSNRRSYLAALTLAAGGSGSERDVAWFAEDDYLYTRQSLRHLVQAAASVPTADYFALYGSSALDTTAGGRQVRRRPRPGAVDDPDKRPIDGVDWFRAVSTTSTFGVRLGALREDLAILRLCPYTGGAFDHTSSVAVQGFVPFTAADLRADLLPGSGWPRSALRGVARVGISARALRRPHRRRSLIASDPELIQHMELGNEDPDLPQSERTHRIDWAGEARAVAAWGAAAGISVPAMDTAPRG